ncbi:MAG: DUF3500 domain-containing protein [Rhizobiaceae bacterium]
MRKSLLVYGAASIIAVGAAYFTFTRLAGGGGGDVSRLTTTNINFGATAIPDTSTACGSEPGTTRLICLIDLLKTGASDDVLTYLQVDYSVAEAKKWSNLPAGGYRQRPGITLGELTEEQRGLVKAILTEAMGLAPNEGTDELVQALNADDYIETVTTDHAGYSSSNFYLAFLGKPAASGTWQLYYGGHHTAVTNTFKDGVLVGATPSFRGIEPFPSVEMNGRENRPLTQERDAFAAMLSSLSADQQANAKIKGTFTDVVAGPQNDDEIAATPEGISVSELSAEQQALVMAAIETYVGDIDAANAATILAKYKSELPQTVVGFSGTTAMDSENDYVRIDGPSIWLEFSLQSNKSTDAEGIHPHSIWRDKTWDYGGNKE